MEVCYYLINRIDDWIFNSQKFYIFFDDNYDTWYYSDFTGSNLCGSSNSDESSYITLSYSLHTFNSVAVRLFSDCVYDVIINIGILRIIGELLISHYKYLNVI